MDHTHFFHTILISLQDSSITYSINHKRIKGKEDWKWYSVYRVYYIDYIVYKDTLPNFITIYVGTCINAHIDKKSINLSIIFK